MKSRQDRHGYTLAERRNHPEFKSEWDIKFGLQIELDGIWKTIFGGTKDEVKNFYNRMSPEGKAQLRPVRISTKTRPLKPSWFEAEPAETPGMAPADILALPIEPKISRIKADTILDYLKAVWEKLWEDPEDFNGKRPFGNSGWKLDIYAALIAGGAVAGIKDSLGEDSYGDCDEAEADRIIQLCVQSLISGTGGTDETA